MVFYQRYTPYADIAYVGGALDDTGLHNTLEPAVFGVPIIIGNHYEKFPEAEQMIENGGMFAISNQNEFSSVLTMLLGLEEKRNTAGNINSAYIQQNTGANNPDNEFLTYIVL